MINFFEVAYAHPNKDVLFTDLSFNINSTEKIALIGQNGSGKSALLQLITKQLLPTSGTISNDSKIYYVPQIHGQYNDVTVAEALGVSDKINAMNRILKGSVDQNDFDLLDNDWHIENRCAEALSYWNLHIPNLQLKLEQLSGGQKTKVFLAGIFLHESEIILMDEPSNHLDTTSRQLLYNFAERSTKGLILVSHDRTLLNLTTKTYEIAAGEVKIYGGNYDFYKSQKDIEIESHFLEIQAKESELRKAKDQHRKTMERQERNDVRGKKKQQRAGTSRIMMNTLRNNAENSTSTSQNIHQSKITNISESLSNLRSETYAPSVLKLNLKNSILHQGKTLIRAEDLNINLAGQLLWTDPVNLHIVSGMRLAIHGMNGSGKTTLLNILIGNLKSTTGNFYSTNVSTLYFDQDYSILDNSLTVYEFANSLNDGGLEEHEIKIRLNRFQFSNDTWDNLCFTLSGGQRMKLILCCLTIREKSPDIIFMDEPTNNLDIQSMEILTSALSDYQGTLIVVSHDETFLRQLNITENIHLG